MGAGSIGVKELETKNHEKDVEVREGLPDSRSCVER